MINQPQCESLHSIYTAFDGANWSVNTNWGTATDVETWSGVSRSGAGVTGIGLSSLNLSGNIEDVDLTGLTGLVGLYLDHNNIGGSIDGLDLSGLSQLAYAHLHENHIGGDVGGLDLSGLTSLTLLYLGYNTNITGDIATLDLSGAPNMEVFSLSENDVYGDIATFNFTGLPLRSLYLRGNRLTGDPSQLAFPPTLRALHLFDNQLNGTVPDLTSADPYLWLGLCGTGNVINPSGIAAIDDYAHIHDETGWTTSTGCGDTTLITSAVCNGDNLDISLTTGDGPFSITGTGADLPGTANIGMLTLAGPGAWTGVTVTETTGDGETAPLGNVTCGDGWLVDCSSPAHLAALMINQPQCESLHSIYTAFDGANWTDNTNWGTVTVIDTWYGVTRLSSITHLTLPNNGLTGDISALDLSGLTQLEMLTLAGNSIGGDLSDLDLTGLSQLNYLNLDNNQIGGEIGGLDLTGMDQLAAITLINNEISGDITTLDLADAPVLYGLALSDNEIGGDIAGFDLTGSTTLVELWLSNNLISGDPGQVSYPDSLTRLYLDNNLLNGTVPYLPVAAIPGDPVSSEELRLCGGVNVINPTGSPAIDDFAATYDLTGWTTSTGCGDTTLITSAVCNGDNLDISLTTGDGPFSITGTGADLPGTANIGMLTLAGPGVWTGVTVSETTGDGETAPLGNFTCGLLPPEAPILSAPAGAITDAAPDFVWGVSARAAGYELTITDDVTSSVVFSQTYDASAICSAETCTVIEPFELTGTAYTWSVTASNPAGSTPATESLSFNLVTAPVAPVLLSPHTTALSKAPDFMWEESPAAVEYTLHIIDHLNGAEVFAETYSAELICESGICSVRMPVILTGAQYAWYVEASNLAGNAASSPSVFTYITTQRSPGR